MMRSQPCPLRTIRLLAPLVLCGAVVASQDPPRSPRPASGAGAGAASTNDPRGSDSAPSESPTFPSASTPWRCTCNEAVPFVDGIPAMPLEPGNAADMAKATRELVSTLDRIEGGLKSIAIETRSLRPILKSFLESRRTDEDKKRLIYDVVDTSTAIQGHIAAIESGQERLILLFDRPSAMFPRSVQEYLISMAPRLRERSLVPPIRIFDDPERREPNVSDHDRFEAAIAYAERVSLRAPMDLAGVGRIVESTRAFVDRMDRMLPSTSWWLDSLDIELIPGQITPERRVTQDVDLRLDRWRRFACGLDELIAGWPALNEQCGPEPFWRRMASDVLPRRDRLERAEMPDVRGRYLDLVGRLHTIEHETDRRSRQETMQRNLRRNLGTWLSDRLDDLEPGDDPETIRRWTCVRNLAMRWREGRPLR